MLFNVCMDMQYVVYVVSGLSMSVSEPGVWKTLNAQNTWNRECNYVINEIMDQHGSLTAKLRWDVDKAWIYQLSDNQFPINSK